MNRKVLQITVHFSPNVGGVETHIDDLVNSLIKRNWEVFVLAYRPLSTKIKWKIFQKEKNLSIVRIPWISGFFEKLVQHPAIEFLYLLPGLFFLTPFVILFFRPDVLHGHGLSAGFAAAFWGKIFRIRSIISIHSIYHFPRRGAYRNFVKFLFNLSDHILCLSQQSVDEICSLGIPSSKIKKFTYWIDLEKFKEVEGAKKILGWEGKFVVLFVGRLIPEKGIAQLLKSARMWNSGIFLKITGSGPLDDYVKKNSSQTTNVEYLGVTSQEKLPLLYSAADLLILPSTSEEGFGRVIIEALSCGTAVIGAQRGAIPEAIDSSVGKIIKITPLNIKTLVEYFYKSMDELTKLGKNARKFTERRYSENNVSKITETYTN